MAVHTNTIFRVDSANGHRYALRICTPGEHTLEDNLAEVAWLTALARDTQLNVATPILNQTGEYVTLAHAEGVPEERRCILFSWIPGEVLEHQLSEPNYWKLGLAAALLHNHAANFVMPADLRPMRWDRVFYWPGEPIVVFESAYDHLFPPARRELIREVINSTEPVLQKLYRDTSNAMVIHGDLHVWNVHVRYNELYLLDFEDLLWGYPAQDVAITLSYGQDWEHYAALRAAFEEGYCSLRSWPIESEHQLQSLIAARRLMFVNYAAHTLSDAKAYIEEVCQKLAGRLDCFRAV